MAKGMDVFRANKAAKKRTESSLSMLAAIEGSLSKMENFDELQSLGIFCAGSIARNEVGSKSDIDLFVLSSCQLQIEREDVFERLQRALLDLPFSDLGSEKYQKIYSIPELISKTGTPYDDTENLFTARMLLILEGRPVFNTPLVIDARRNVINHYFRDSDGSDHFQPFFLLNDILRYWRTLCLNYERKRNDETQPWRKKNVNLKFARMLTVFSTVLAIISRHLNNVESICDLCKLTPMERLIVGIDEIGDEALYARLPEILEIYEEFLRWKEADLIDAGNVPDDLKLEIQEKADTFSGYLHEALSNDAISPRLRQFLVI